MRTQEAHLRLVRELAVAHAVVAATQTGLLSAIANADGPTEDVARELGLDPEGVEHTLDVLETAGWLERETDGWRVADWVLEAQPDDLSFRRTAAVFGHLPQLLKDGSTMQRGEVRHDAEGVRGLAQLFGEAPNQLARLLPAPSGTLLDIGAGSAIWSLAMARDDVKVIAIDRPEVLQAATRLAAETGKTEQLVPLPGSFWEVDFPPANRVIIANVVHLTGDEGARRLVERAVEALEPGGDLVIVDVLGDDPTPETVAYAMHLRLREPHGTVFGAAQMEGWLIEAGLDQVRTIAIEGQAIQLGAVTGRRPG